MIKVGIIGAESPVAGELLRILIHHPEVDILSLYAPSLPGHRVSSVHHGFIGESELFFTDKMDPAQLDVIFISDDSSFARSLIEHIGDWEELRVIDLAPGRIDSWAAADFEYGLSEINRKALVRGARLAVIPSPVASAALIALYPLASHLLLNSDISIAVSLPDDMKRNFNSASVAAEISKRLKVAQTSFEGHISFSLLPSLSQRAMSLKIEMKCPLGIEEISKIYESVYDDHNFTFTSRDSSPIVEVEGTQKCLISFSKPGAGLLEINVVGDARLRGGAGDAVHVMNLLFSLHEKVGLTLKPSSYLNAGEQQDIDRSAWFS